MQLSAKTQNACLAMMELARQYADRRPVSLKTIAEKQNISSQFLVQILLQLKRTGLVQSVRGACGGYRLTKPPTAITLFDIISAMEGNAENAVPHDATPAARVLHESWQSAQDSLHTYFSGVTLSELVDRVPDHSDDMYYI